MGALEQDVSKCTPVLIHIQSAQIKLEIHYAVKHVQIGK